MSILVLIFPYILMYGIFNNFGNFWLLLEPWDSILGYLINLGVWKCYIRAQRGWKWGSRTKNEYPSPEIFNILMYGIFTNFGHFWPIFEPWDSILGYIITLVVWKCYIRVQRGWKWGSRSKNEHHSHDISIYTDVWHFYQFCPFLTQFWSLGTQFWDT